MATTLGQRRQLADRAPPAGEDLVAPARVRPDAERAAEVVEDDRRVGKRAREVGQLGDLRVVEPGVELRPRRRARRSRGGSPRRPKSPGGGLVCELRTSWLASQPAAWRMPRKRGLAAMCASSTAPTPSPSVRSAKLDDAGGDARRPVARRSRLIAATPSTNSVSPTGRSASGPSRAVHRHALDEHRATHVVPAARVGEQLVDQVAAAGMVPQVMVRVADRQVGLEDVLLHLREPLIAVRRRHRRDPEGGGLVGRIGRGVEPVAHPPQELAHRRLRPEPPRDLVPARRRSHRHASLEIERLQIVRAPADEAARGTPAGRSAMSASAPSANSWRNRTTPRKRSGGMPLRPTAVRPPFLARHCS